MSPVILFRSELSTEGEEQIAREYFDVHTSRVTIPRNSLVIGRYSCLPFYHELEKDLAHLDARLINSYREHSYIADFDYYYDVEPYTPKTWFRLHEAKSHGGPYVLKGRTNSRKHQWREKMYAETFQDAVRIHIELSNDPLIGPQGVLIREYLPLRRFETGPQDLPFTNEWRLFFFGKEVLSYGYYWSSAEGGTAEKGREAFLGTGLPFAKMVAEKISMGCAFFVLDVAETEEGVWTLIEANDGQMSGLSENDPKELYSNLRRVLDK